MIIPNIIGIIALSPLIIKSVKDYDKKAKIEKGKANEQLTTP